MLFNTKTILTGIVLAIAGLVFSQPAHATFFTELANMDIKTLVPPQGAPVLNISTISESQGQSFVNSYSLNADGTVNVRAVTVDVISGVNNPNAGFPTGGPGNSTSSGTPTSLLVLSVLNGTTIAPGSSTVQFNGGGVAVFNAPSVNAGTFNPLNPNSYGVNFTAANEIISGVLAPPTDVLPGNGFPITPVSSSQVNVAGVSTGAGSLLPNGTVLFDITNNPNPDSAGLIPFITVQNPLGLPGPISIFTNFGETTDSAPINANALAVLNQAAGLFLGNLGGANTAFATGQGHASTDYNPGDSLNPINTFGDFAANLNAIVAFPGIDSPVPEPTSMVLLASGSVLAGLFAARRRKNAKKA